MDLFIGNVVKYGYCQFTSVSTYVYLLFEFVLEVSASLGVT